MSYDFLKKKFFWSDPPGPAQGGYFKEFWQIFAILGFKWYQMGPKCETVVTKKLHLD